MILKGKTLKGKNRIKEHGENWKIIKADKINGVLYESKKDKYMIWDIDDKLFEIVEK